MHQTWPLVYFADQVDSHSSVERTFSSMNYIKNELRNCIGDKFLNGCFVCYVECKIFTTVRNDAIIHHFQHMKSRRAQL